eukprot:CCRYP_007647-RA/>CCRYP_007647-RA protein AED:0.00 eAED:0.00 QI:49/1/1/1/0/0/2/432/127
MPAVTALHHLLSTMEPVLHPDPYGYSVTETPVAGTFATVAEDEGPTVIAPHAALQAAGVDPGAQWARISLTVHSDLAAVGLTAAFARALADRGISANVVAGFHHDHIFVPWLRRLDAMTALQELSRD